MMATAPPATFDPIPVYFPTPMFQQPAPPAPAKAAKSSASSVLEILKIIVGLIIAVMLGAILAAYILLPRENRTVDLRESNENIARLDREQQTRLESERQKHVEKMAEQKRVIDQAAERQRQEFQLFLSLEQRRDQLAMQQKELDLLVEKLKMEKEWRSDERMKENEDILLKFIDDVSMMSQPLNLDRIGLKVFSLLRRLDPVQKSSLITFLYKINVITSSPGTGQVLDLRGADLKDLSLSDMSQDFNDVQIRTNFSHLALPATNLVNASLEKIDLSGAVFNSSNLIGASFRSSNVTGADFERANLALSDFRQATLRRSKFSFAKLQSSTFGDADLSNAVFERADLTSAKFFNAELHQAQLHAVLAPGANFYSAKMEESNFAFGYLPNINFQYADLQQASFRSAFLTGANFDSANVYNADFTRANLVGVNITEGQLQLALSIAYAILPNGLIGKNKNLIRKTVGECTDSSNNILEWNTVGLVTAYRNESISECVYQASSVNATLEQRLNIAQYRPLLQEGRSRLYIELNTNVTVDLRPMVYMNIKFVDENNNPTGPPQTTLSSARLTPPSTFIASVPCPAGTSELQLALVFDVINAQVHGIYVTLE